MDMAHGTATIALPEVLESQECHVVLCGRDRAMSAVGTLGWNW